MEPTPTIQKKLLNWYRKNARHDLPWRKTSDPYRILVSEVMLQQTQVSTVIPYYQRFLKRFPTPRALAKAPVSAVLDSWSGLGYYSRARSLHAAAQKVVREHQGKIPQEVDQLLELPGVGRYTAGAVASIAFDRPAPILDGNVIRVLCRYFAIREDPSRSAVQRKLWELSEQLLPNASPGTFNQALMELGALVCVPGTPLCSRCPVKEGCLARRYSLQEKIPPARTPPRRKRIRYLVGILERNGSVLLARRPLGSLLPGLWEFPGGEGAPGESEPQGLSRRLKERLCIRAKPIELRCCLEQVLTHRVIEIRAFNCRWSGSPRLRWYLEARWIPKVDLKKIPFTAGMAKLAKGLCLFALCGSLCALSLSGCATVGPQISREELKSAQEYYEVKSLRHMYHQAIRVRTVGEQLLTCVPQELHPKNPKPFLGTLLDDLTLTSGRVFAVDERAPWRTQKGCLITGVIPHSPVVRAGIEAGDLLLRLNDQPTPSLRKVQAVLKKIKPQTPVTFLLEREGVVFSRRFLAAAKPYPVNFTVSDEEDVNAYATPGLITVTTGLLRFIASDDELAVVMGHELAHLTQGHYAKQMGTDVVAGTIGMVVGIAVGVIAPGVGGVISRMMAAGIRAPFSQDFEREADYVGLRYAHQAGYQIEAGITFWDRFATELPKSISQSFFNTHPTSPERLLRLQKTVQEIKGKAPPVPPAGESSPPRRKR